MTTEQVEAVLDILHRYRRGEIASADDAADLLTAATATASPASGERMARAIIDLDARHDHANKVWVIRDDARMAELNASLAAYLNERDGWDRTTKLASAPEIARKFLADLGLDDDVLTGRLTRILAAYRPADHTGRR